MTRALPYLLLGLLTACPAPAAPKFRLVPFPWGSAVVTGNHLTPGAVAYWRFEEATGNALDSSGNGRTLTENGTLASGTGVVDDCRVYDKSVETDYFSRSADSAFGFSGDFTVTAWVQFDIGPPDTDDMSVISMGDFTGANFSWLIELDSGVSDDLISFYWSTDGTFNPGNVVQFTVTGGVTDTVWYFIVVRRTGSTLHISATDISDGSVATDATGTVSGALFYDGTDQLRVGDLEGSDIHDMNGLIDEMGVWSRYLSDCEVGWLFTAKAGSFTWPDFDSNTCAP